MKKKYDTSQLFSSLFEFVYGMSSEQQLAFCQLRLPPDSRVSLSAEFDAKWLYQKINHLTRLIAAGRGEASFADNLYSSNPLSIIKPTTSFVGATIAIPISYKG